MISIHAPPRGATSSVHGLHQGYDNFNSRPSARGDALVCVQLAIDVYFNSRPSARGDARGSYDGMYRDISIHAPPRGATSSKPCLKKAYSYFNSRPSARGDRIVRKGGHLEDISIHAPPRGATFARAESVLAVFVFQFTPLREGRQAICPIDIYAKLFQFTPLREGRR